MPPSAEDVTLGERGFVGTGKKQGSGVSNNPGPFHFPSPPP
jgi:hypothetical protein